MLKNRKQRPPNGPGANGLRGGTNLYSTKTTIGRWQDDIGGPSAFQRGFNTPEFETEAQHQQRGATLQAPSYYGSELSKTDDNEKTTDPVWETTARNMSIGNRKVLNIDLVHTFRALHSHYSRFLKTAEVKDFFLLKFLVYYYHCSSRYYCDHLG